MSRIIARLLFLRLFPFCSPLLFLQPAMVVCASFGASHGDFQVQDSPCSVHFLPPEGSVERKRASILLQIKKSNIYVNYFHSHYKSFRHVKTVRVLGILNPDEEFQKVDQYHASTVGLF